METQERVKEVIMEQLKDFFQDGNLTFESNLDESGVDSISFVQLIIQLENEFDIEIDDEKLAKTDFTMLNDVVDYVVAMVEEE